MRSLSQLEISAKNPILGGTAMVQQVTPETTIEAVYPESDGQQMADNTEQFA